MPSFIYCKFPKDAGKKTLPPNHSRSHPCGYQHDAGNMAIYIILYTILLCAVSKLEERQFDTKHPANTPRSPHNHSTSYYQLWFVAFPAAKQAFDTSFHHFPNLLGRDREGIEHRTITKLPSVTGSPILDHRDHLLPIVVNVVACRIVILSLLFIILSVSIPRHALVNI